MFPFKRPQRLFLPVAFLLAACGLSFAVGLYSYARAIDQSVAVGSGTLRLAATALSGHLARYEALPTLIAERPRCAISSPVRSTRRCAARRTSI